MKPKPSLDTRDAADTKVSDAILNAAERAFAELGYGGASMRAITRDADVNQAMISYYFGSKEGLFTAVIGRRSGAINAERLAELDRLRGLGSFTMDDLLKALIAPAIRLSSDPDRSGSAYMKLVGQLINSTDDMSQRVLSENFDHIARIFVAEICKLNPGLSSETASRGYVYTIALTMAAVGSEWRMNALSDGSDGTRDIDHIIGTSVAFSVAGIKALIEMDAIAG